MKRRFLMGSMFCMALAVTADDVTRIDASKVRRMTFNGDQVTVTYNDGTPQATLDMGAVVVDFSTATSVEQRAAIVKKTGLQGKKVYDMTGREVVNGQWLMVNGRLKPGIYMIDGKKVSIK